MVSELRFRASEVSQTPLGGCLCHTTNGIQPFRHVASRECLQKIVASVLCVKLKGKRPLVVDEMRHFCIHDVEDEHRLSRRRKIKLSGRLFNQTKISVRCKGARDWSHELKEGRRHAFLVTMLSLRCGGWLPWINDLVDTVISFFCALFILLFLANAVPQEFIALYFLLLHLDNLLEWPYCFSGRSVASSC